MKLFNYIKYFFYLGLNWNWKLAATLILQEVKGEKKYGIDTTGADELKKLTKTGVDTSHATIYMPVSYAILENIFTRLPLKPRHHLLDIGCGKGRVLCVAAYNGFSKVSGIDFSKNFCEAAEQNLLITKEKVSDINYDVIVKNIQEYELPDDVDCIFLFNPFDTILMQQLVEKILENLDRNPRLLHIIYANPLDKKLFTGAGFTEIFHNQRMEYFEVSILKNEI